MEEEVCLFQKYGVSKYRKNCKNKHINKKKIKKIKMLIPEELGQKTPQIV